VLDLVLVGALVPVFDDRILDEYREVLSRPRFGFEAAAVATFLQGIESGERIDAPSLDLDLPDPDDAPFVEVAVAANADALVTGNRRHFPPSCGAMVVSPAELLRRLAT
jgi:putative PIN family toxin of toxin-antitoxin system